MCFNRAAHTPGDGVVRIVRLPNDLRVEVTHSYGANSFKLHGLPQPRAGHVLGLLGSNGIGKSTALSILSGKLKPNLGELDPSTQPGWHDLVKHYRGSALQNYFSSLAKGALRTTTKPQLDSAYHRSLRGRTVSELLAQADERNSAATVAAKLQLTALANRRAEDLSGGEVQRLAIAITVLRDVDVYIIDEMSSFLDVAQRIEAADVVRSLIEPESWGGHAATAAAKYVIVVEHDLAVLDYVSSSVVCLFGEPGAYGVVSKPSGVGNAINQYVAGYLRQDNVRIRSEPLLFAAAHRHDQPLSADAHADAARYAECTHALGASEAVAGFTLRVEAGSVRRGECLALLGENGTGKSTLMRALAGELGGTNTVTSGGSDVVASGTVTSGTVTSGTVTSGAACSLAHMGVSWKRQDFAAELREFGGGSGTVSELLEARLQAALADASFRRYVLEPLGLSARLQAKQVGHLSGGELQRLAIAVALGTPAIVYMLDEPSAFLDVEQRLVAAKVIDKWVLQHLGCAAVLIEHDLLMASALATRTVVFSGVPGTACVATAPDAVADGFNAFLRAIDVTIRRDLNNLRPKVNKRGGGRDREQKSENKHFVFSCDDE